MGKPFKQELELVYNTYLYSYSLKIDEAKEFIEEHQYPIYFVGSGGSLSACHYASSLVQANGRFAKAITPLELISLKNSVKSSIVIFISAGGNNKDIILGFKEAVKQEPKGIGCFCMKKNSLLSELSKKYTLSRIFEFDLPSGNDGFLATNSLVAFYTILYRIFSENNNEILIGDYKEETNEIIDSFLKRISPNHTIHILYAGWGHSVAIDLESKCTESALINTLIADFRNFGHGRHHWFAKKENNSSIVALVTPTYWKIRSN